MDEKRLQEILRDLGLSKKQADIYLFLSRAGPQKANIIATHFNIDRAQIYRSLKSLQEKGIIQLTIEAPTRYIAVPIELLIESHIESKKSEVARIEAEKTDLIDYLHSLSKKDQEYPMAKFQVITGKSGIFTKISQMVNNASKEVLSLTTSVGLIEEDTAGIQDTIIETARKKRDLQFKILANVSNENLKTIKSIIKQVPVKNANIELRHIELGLKSYPRFVIVDEEETILYLISGEVDTALWITSKIFVSTLKASFTEMWGNAINIRDRINELETGKPVEETKIIKEPADAQTKITNVLDTTKNEITLISSSTGINKISENDPFRKYADQGIKLRIMAPIDLDNLESAQRLSKLYEVKHVSISYLTMMIADGKHLFIFKIPTPEEETESPFYLRNVFYTNDQKYVERAGELLKDIWKRGTLLSETPSDSFKGKPTLEVSSSDNIQEVVGVMMKNVVSSVLVAENNMVQGIIDQRDILNKVVRERKDPKSVTAKEIMSTPVMAIDSDESMVELLKTMKRKRIPRLAVLKKGRLIAVLT